MAEASQEQQLKEQKANCIFCKIIAGEVFSRKIYEDDKVLAVLDINPAAKGHTVIMPKEHYPILPVIPFLEQQHLFKKTFHVMEKIKEALLCKEVTIFIANGGVAGQQSPHFIYHLIPREKGDFLPFDPQGNISQEENNADVEKIKPRINALMNAYLQEVGRQDLALHNSPPTPPQEEESAPDKSSESTNKPASEDTIEITGMTQEQHLERLINTIDGNADLKDALIHRPEEVKEAIRTRQKFKDLFGTVNVDELSQNLKILMAQKIKKNKSGAIDLDKVGDVL